MNSLYFFLYSSILWTRIFFFWYCKGLLLHLKILKSKIRDKTKELYSKVGSIECTYTFDRNAILYRTIENGIWHVFLESSLCKWFLKQFWSTLNKNVLSSFFHPVAAVLFEIINSESVHTLFVSIPKYRFLQYSLQFVYLRPGSSVG